MIVRDTNSASLWVRWMARAMMRREARILALLDHLPGVPSLIDLNPTRLRRQFLAGMPMQEAKPTDPAYFKEAARLLRKLHLLGVAHNDLAKEPNFLVTADGRPAFLDFQLALTFGIRSAAFGLIALSLEVGQAVPQWAELFEFRFDLPAGLIALFELLSETFGALIA